MKYEKQFREIQKILDRRAQPSLGDYVELLEEVETECELRLAAIREDGWAQSSGACDD